MWRYKLGGLGPNERMTDEGYFFLPQIMGIQLYNYERKIQNDNCSSDSYT